MGLIKIADPETVRHNQETLQKWGAECCETGFRVASTLSTNDRGQMRIQVIPGVNPLHIADLLEKAAQMIREHQLYPNQTPS
jgi:aspartate-semialdehyde dehydrogenase